MIAAPGVKAEAATNDPGDPGPWKEAMSGCSGAVDTTTWESVDCGGDGLSSLPASSYPKADPSGDLSLYSNNLSNVDGLVSLTQVGGRLNLFNNNLTDISGLSSLTSVGGTLSIGSNQMENLDGLDSLRHVGGDFNLRNGRLTNVNGIFSLETVEGSLVLEDNRYLTDISGLENVVVGAVVFMDDRNDYQKLPAGSPFCQNRFDDGFDSATHDQVCQ